MIVQVSGKVYDDDEVNAIKEAAEEGHWTEGKFCKKFSRKLSAYTGIRKTFLTNSGSSANLISLAALKEGYHLPEGSKILTFAAGFPTTITPIIQLGFEPVFVDCRAGTYVPEPGDIAKAIKKYKPVAIMAAHTLGNAWNIEEAEDILRIEDCCDALGTYYDGDHVGQGADFATCSFYPAHHITTAEGGAVFTQSPTLADMVSKIGNWGRDCWCPTGCNNTCGKRFDWFWEYLPEGYDHKYVYSHLGYNVKMSDLHAAIGCVQIDRMEEFRKTRKFNFQYLLSQFKSRGWDEYFILPEESYKSKTNWFGFPLTIRIPKVIETSEIMRFLVQNKVDCRVLFGGNLTKQPAFKEYRENFVGADKIMYDSFWVGCWHGLEKMHLDYMLSVFEKFIKKMIKEYNNASLRNL